jgi:hypothetical protein
MSEFAHRVVSTRSAVSRNGLNATTALGGLIALSIFAAPQAAIAAQECGAGTSGTITCSATGNPYAGGITYTPTDSLTLITNSDVRATNSVSVRGVGTTHVTNNGTIATTGDGTAFTQGASGIIASGTTGTIVDGTGAISTSGFNARGIDATSTGTGAVTVNVGNVSTTGIGGGGPGFFPNSSAIFANTDSGGIAVTAGTLATAGDFASGVQAISNTGAITVNTGAITTTGNNANGVTAQTYGTGATTVTSTGTINTAGQAAYGVTIAARNGTATANVADINTTGFDSTALDVQGGTAANATFGSLSTTQAFSQDAIAQATGDVTISGANAKTTGVDSGAVYAISDTGNASVTTTGTVSTTGATSLGIYAGSNTGNATVVANNVSTTGNNAQAITAKGANASVTVNGAVSTLGTQAYSSATGTAVSATGTNGTATVVNNGTITTAGAGSTGILASGTTGVTISGAGSVATTGANANGIYATSTNGPVSVSEGAVSVSGAGSSGVLAQTYGVGSNATINVGTINVSGGAARAAQAYSANGVASVTTGNVTAANGSGIFAVGDQGATVNSGTVTITGADTHRGVLALAFNGNASVTATGNTSTTGARSTAITSQSYNGMATVVNNGAISTTGLGSDGIYANGTSGVTISGTGSVSTAGNYADAIFATSANGPVGVTQGNIATTGQIARGVVASAPNGNVTVDVGNVSTSGTQSGPFFFSPAATGILATSGTGNVAVTANTVSTAGGYANGITARSNGGNVAVTAANVSTSGANANGVFGYSTGVGNVVLTTTGTVAATGGAGIANYGVYGNVEGGTGNVSINSNIVNVSGGNSTAIAAKTSLGNADVKFGTVSSTGGGFNSGGVMARSYGGGAVTVSGANASTTGDFSYGIFAYSNSERATGTANNGAVTVTTTGAVTTTGVDSVGVGAFAQNGAANVTANTVSTSGAGAIGIVASSVAGPASVTLNGAATATAAPVAIQIFGGTTSTLTLGAGGSLTAAGHGAQLTSVAGSTVNNGGTIIGDGITPILTATGGALTFNNSGTFTGLVGFTGGNDVVNNSGTYRALYSQDFGAGTDTFNNSGTFAVLPGTATAGTVSLTGLEAFNNSGTVDLRNGHAGDVLNTSSTFAGAGNSALGIDVAFGTAGATSLADRLVATGAITGSTALLVNPVGANGAILNSGTVFATGGAGSSATAFTVAPQLLNQGFIRYNVAFNAANNTYSLFGTPGDAVYRTLKINEGAQQLWYKSAEAWSGHMSDLRDAKFAGGGADGGRIWGQIYGGVNTRDAAQNVSAFGQSRAVDLSYKQDAFGGQLGMDVGSRDMGSGNFVFGVTGGYLNSDLSFRNSADRVTYGSANLGAYASYVSGGFFANALGKYDYLWITSKSPLAGYRDKFHGMSYGAQGEIGFRIGSDSFYAEPVASAAYVRTDLKDLQALGATVDFDKLDGLRGKAGLRVGSKFDMGGGSTALLYAQGNYVHEFKGRDGVAFTSGGTTLDYGNRPIGNYGEGKVGFSVVSAGGVTGFVEGFGQESNNYKGGGGRAGIRAKF